MPAAARHSVSALVGLNAVMGFFGAFTFPMQKVLLRDWAPLSLGTERVWALRAGAYGMQAGIVATTFLTPLLAAKFGWRLVPRLYGTALVIGGAIWQMVAVNTPAEWKGISEEELALLTQHKVGRAIIAGIWVAFFQECQRQSCGQAHVVVAPRVLRWQPQPAR